MDNQKTEKITQWLDDKNVTDIEVIDLTSLEAETDCFIIGTALNERNARAVCDYIEEKAKEENVALIGKEGYDSGKWILVDFSDVVLHIFIKSERELYNLEKLWSSGEFLSMRKNIKNETD